MIHVRQVVKLEIGISKIKELTGVAQVSIGIPRQIIKLAGLSLKENTSGKHKGQTKITKRGRKSLRALLFRVAMPLVAKNSAFKALHEYYTKRPNNPLKKMQSLIAICNKVIRILFAIGKKQCEFSEERMLQDIPHMATLKIAA